MEMTIKDGVWQDNGVQWVDVTFEDELGQMIGQILNLRQTPNGHYKTRWGTKSSIGLGKLVLHVMREAEQRVKERNKQ